MIDARFKTGLLAGFALVVGYFTWPYWEPPPLPAETEGKLPLLEAGWLNIQPGAGTGRDPFALPASRRPAKPKPTAIAARSGVRKPPRSARKPGEAPLPALSLGAVLIHGERRAAILNGRVYRTGMPLKLDDPDVGRWKLDRVAPDGVIVAEVSGPRTLKVAFPSRKAARTAPKAADPSGRPALGIAEAEALRPGVLEQLAAESGGNVGVVYGKLWQIFLGQLSGRPAAPAGRNR